MNPGPTHESSVHANGFAEERLHAPPAGPAPSARPGFFERLFRRLFPKFSVPLHVALWNGEEFATAPGVPIARVRFRERSVFLGVMMNPDLGFGDGYSDGRIELEGDLVAFLESVFRAPRPPASVEFLRRLLVGWRLRPSANSLKPRATTFPTITTSETTFTSSGSTSRWSTPAPTSRRRTRRWRRRPRWTTSAARCGCGRARRSSRPAVAGARWPGTWPDTTASRSRRSTSRASRSATPGNAQKAEGLEGRVEYVEDDYRNITGRCDAFVSVGMLEHVGADHYRELGGVIRRCLKPDGRGLVHAIGRNFPEPTSPWLEKRIFPGSYMPSLREFMGVFEPCGFSVLDVENLRLHYAKTLDHWLRRFEASADAIEGMFDKRLVRAYRFYLAASRASFSAGVMQLFQVVFAPVGNNDIPWTRAFVYDRRTDKETRRQGDKETGSG